MTTPLLKKLNHKEEDIMITNAPTELQLEITAMKRDPIRAISEKGKAKAAKKVV